MVYGKQTHLENFYCKDNNKNNCLSSFQRPYRSS